MTAAQADPVGGNITIATGCSYSCARLYQGTGLTAYTNSTGALLLFKACHARVLEMESAAPSTVHIGPALGQLLQNIESSMHAWKWFAYHDLATVSACS